MMECMDASATMARLRLHLESPLAPNKDAFSPHCYSVYCFQSCYWWLLRTVTLVFQFRSWTEVFSTCADYRLAPRFSQQSYVTFSLLMTVHLLHTRTAVPSNCSTGLSMQLADLDSLSLKKTEVMLQITCYNGLTYTTPAIKAGDSPVCNSLLHHDFLF